MNILIVDDDPAYQILVRSALEKYGPCDIVDNGKHALEAFQRALRENNPYDLITLDIVMPDINGSDTLKAIRKIEQDNGIKNSSDSVKVIIITAMDDTDNCMEAMDAGCEAFIIKPFAQDELIEKVDSYCRIDENNKEPKHPFVNGLRQLFIRR